ncbi:MAG: alpha-amylase family protein [Calothrix sp. MO_167.B12]|nr:alpha-amylase family protein [Calothrix sp. MO_167.B12]
MLSKCFQGLVSTFLITLIGSNFFDSPTALGSVTVQASPQQRLLASKKKPNLPRTVFVHLFEWKWTDIAQECENSLGPKGYSAVQISPPQEHRLVKNFPWYQRYQPVSYKLESRGGTRREFVEMVQRCKKVGVDIYVDAVINHMTGVLEPGKQEIGSGGSLFRRYQFPDYNYQDFHHCDRNGNDDIQNWNDRYEVQNCELLNLSDLDTGAKKVRSRIAAYLNDLISIGVAGFRIDAAKHMSTNDLEAIFSKLRGKPYIYQEVIANPGEPIQTAEYFPTGDVTEFKYSLGIAPIFRNGKLADLQRFATDKTMMPSNKAIVFLDNHDNQRGHGTGGQVLTFKDGQLYVLANIFMLAFPYGYPKVMSSYQFQTDSQGPPSNTQGRTNNIYNPQGKNIGCQQNWVCEHRIKAIANMVGFRNYTNNDFVVSNWWSNGKNQIAFGRGNKGFVVINRENNSLSRRFQTGLPGGTYCNVVTGELTKNGRDCTGNKVTVDTQGFANIQTPGQNAVAIHGGQKVSR